jgi:uncharacterized protein YdcH (DUF465 family)
MIPAARAKQGFASKILEHDKEGLANRNQSGRQEERPMSISIPEAELREQLLRENAEYRRLAAEHQSYSEQLEDLTNKHYLSEEEQLQEKTLKKKKLMLKDQMYSLVQKARKQMEAGSR